MHQNHTVALTPAVLDLQFAYARDVDYISAAFIMFPTDLYKNLGGLDPMYGVGYFEDTDLAMAMASKGFKVIYQPLAVVSALLDLPAKWCFVCVEMAPSILQRGPWATTPCPCRCFI